MKYELARELKDAGFPQDGAGAISVNNECLKRGTKHDTTNCVAYVPTLEELIEACGDEFNALYYNASTKGKWLCVINKEIPNWDLVGAASTPTEAVARLWLALNKHD